MTLFPTAGRLRLTLSGLTVAVVLAVAPVLHGITRQSEEDAHAGTLVLLEERFARAVREHGARAAFLEFLAPDGILFRPGPVAGRAYWLAADEDPALLQWYASRAAIASSDDLGYTLGPWSHGRRGARPKSFGHYLRVWRREADSAWRVAVEAVIGHPRRSEARRLTPAVTMHEPGGGTMLRLDVVALEQRFDEAARVGGYESAAAAASAPRSLRMRDGEEPGAVRTADAARSATLHVEGSGLSAAADLGYAYGTVVDDAGSAAFLHIWQLTSGAPYLAVDLLTRNFAARAASETPFSDPAARRSPGTSLAVAQ